MRFWKNGTLLNDTSASRCQTASCKQWRGTDEKRSLGSRDLEASVDEIERNRKLNSVLENIR